MSSTALENLTKIGELKTEPFSESEFDGLLEAATCGINDAAIAGLSYTGKFHLLYYTCHALALAALRRHGLRSDKRYRVFQCLAHTSTLEAPEIRLLTLFHEKRNLAEYEGFLEPDEQLLAEVSRLARRLLEEIDPLDC